MIIFNTTYHTSSSKEEDFIQWLREKYIPLAITNGMLGSPRLACVMNDNPSEDGKSFSLQFEVENLEVLSDWYASTGEELGNEMTKRFGSEVAGFITLLQQIDL